MERRAAFPARPICSTINDRNRKADILSARQFASDNKRTKQDRDRSLRDFCAGRRFVPLGNILNSMFHRNVSYRSYVHLITQARRLGMKREDEYRQLASDILQRASEEQSAVLRAQWEILSASYRELAGQSKKVEENDAQYDPIPWDRMRRH